MGNESLQNTQTNKVTDTIPMTFGTEEKKKANPLIGLTAKLTAAQPWIAAGIGIYQIASSIFQKKKREKEEAAMAAKAETERKRIEGIIHGIDDYAYRYIPSDIKNREYIFWQIIVGLFANKFFSSGDSRLPTFGIVDNTSPMAEFHEFLDVLHRRVGMSTLAQGRNSIAGMFFALPWILNREGKRQGIGIVLRGWKTEQDKRNNPEKVEFLHYFQATDIGMPAQCYDIDNVPWQVSATPERFLPIAFPLKEGLDLSLIDCVYIVPNNISIDNIKSPPNGGLYNSRTVTFDKNTGTFIAPLSKGAMEYDGLATILSSSFSEFYESTVRESMLDEKKQAQYLLDHPEERCTQKNLTDYAYNVEMVTFTPHIQIANDRIVLDWHDEYNADFFKGKALSELPVKIVKLLLYEKGFYKGKINDDIDDSYYPSLNTFRLANHINPMGALDKVTESVLRGTINLTRTWNAYTWCSKDSKGGDIVFDGNLIDSNEVGGIRLKKIVSPIDIKNIPVKAYNPGEMPSPQRLESVTHSIVNEKLSIVKSIVEIYDAHRDTNVTHRIVFPKEYILLGYTLSINRHRDFYGKEISMSTDSIIYPAYYGNHGYVQFTFTVWLQKVQPLKMAAIKSKPYFPIIKDLSDLQLEYARVKSFTDSDDKIKFWVEQSAYYDKDFSQKGSTEIGLGMNRAYISPITFNPDTLFCRWACELSSVDNISPVLTEVELAFGEKKAISVGKLTLPQKRDIILDKLGNVNAMNVPEIADIIEVKKMFLESKIYDIQDIITDKKGEYDRLLADLITNGILGDKNQLLFKELESDLGVEYTSGSLSNEDFKKASNTSIANVESYKLSAIQSCKDKLSTLLQKWEQNTEYSLYNQMLSNSGLSKDDFDKLCAEITKWDTIAITDISSINGMKKLIKESIDGIAYNVNISGEYTKLVYRNLKAINVTEGILKSNIDTALGEKGDKKEVDIVSYCDKMSLLVNDYWDRLSIKIQNQLAIRLKAVITFSTDKTSINEGESCNLSWVVTNAKDVRINGAMKATSGSAVVTPNKSSMYTITAVDATGQALSQSLTITVTPSVVTPSVVTPSVVTPSVVTPSVVTPSVVTKTDSSNMLMPMLAGLAALVWFRRQ